MVLSDVGARSVVKPPSLSKELRSALLTPRIVSKGAVSSTPPTRLIESRGSTLS